MKTPDTTEIVREAIADAGFEDFHNECSHYSGGSGTCRAPEIRPLALAAIAADRKALADAGYVIVSKLWAGGEVPEGYSSVPLKDQMGFLQGWLACMDYLTKYFPIEITK